MMLFLAPDGSRINPLTETVSDDGLPKKDAPGAKDEAGLRLIRWNGLVALVNHPDPARRWQWVVEHERRSDAIYLLSPRGKKWRFKLNRGARIKPT